MDGCSSTGKRRILVYNRLVDFSLEAAGHEALRDAYIAGAVVVTPNPRNHALFADKRNLTLLSDPAAAGLGDIARSPAQPVGCPPDHMVTVENADELWATRKRLFFKPAGGHGGKAVYRGDKVTHRVWAEIQQGGYIAQALAPPANAGSGSMARSSR